MLHMPSFPEMLVILALGDLLFGKRLPEVGKSLGKGIVEFKKGLKGIEDDIDINAKSTQPMTTRLPDQPTQPLMSPGVASPGTPMPKFDPYTGKPLDQTTSSV